LENATLVDHPLRPNILAEMHARPFVSLATPRTILRQAFLCEPSSTPINDLKIFSDWCRQNNLRLPPKETRHHSVKVDSIQLTWERHSEFLTLTWDAAFTKKSHDELLDASKTHSRKILTGTPTLISAVKLDLVSADKKGELNIFNFDTESLCISYVEERSAIIMTDFRQDLYGYTRYAVQNAGMNDTAVGILVRRLLEIETYRCMALLGFEEIKSIAPEIANIEHKLVDLTRDLGSKSDLLATRNTLDAITDIAADLVKLSAASQYRLSATRAYYELVNARLNRIDEEAIKGYHKLEEFVARRLGPAMRTCLNMETRFKVAEKKLSRATELLRTNIDMQMQAQNHQLLETMNNRALMQYRLQTTVEGLSIAAVSYYVVGLFAYIVKGSETLANFEANKVIALSVPVIAIIVWLGIKGVRAKHERQD
jgi:uncharacterized membrane-anchored protein